MLKPLVIFAVGSAVEDWLRYFLADSYFIQQLPHPAGRRRGFRDEHYRVLYFWLVAKALHKAGILGISECKELAETFICQFEFSKT